MKLLSLLLLLTYFTGSSQQDTTLRILFVGNSLTYSHNLPLLIQESARMQGIRVETEMLAKPNYALEDHWQEGELQRRIAFGNYDFVVVQQGPSSQQEGRQMLIEYGAKIKALCDMQSAKLAYFVVWPSQRYYHTFDGVITNYTDAAIANQAILCPVGQAWKAHVDSTNDLSYYDRDGFHPSQKGSMITAQIILKSLLTEIGQ